MSHYEGIKSLRCSFMIPKEKDSCQRRSVVGHNYTSTTAGNQPKYLKRRPRLNQVIADAHIADVLAVSGVELRWSRQIGEQLLLIVVMKPHPFPLMLDVQREKVWPDRNNDAQIEKSFN